MNAIIGDIWQFDKPGNAIALPGNIGWTRKGENVMGAGVAKQAAQRYPTIKKYFGEGCQKYRSRTHILAYEEQDSSMLLFFPVKPLNEDCPWLSWKSKASLDRIDLSCQFLVSYINGFSDVTNLQIYLPVVGCGNGGLEIKDAYPILDQYLFEGKYHLVITPYDLKHIEYLKSIGVLGND